MLQNDGTATWTGGAFLFTGGTFNNNGSFTANSASGLDSYGNGGVNAFNNAGTFTKQGTGLTQFFVNVTAVPFNNSGTVDVQAGTLGCDAGFSQSAGRTILSGGNFASTATIQILDGTLGGVGTVTGNVTSSGNISPGASPGLLTISGNYIQVVGGALNIEVAGLISDASFDRLAVTGTASLAGALNLMLINDFYPPTNANFSFLTVATRSGTFNTFNYPSNDVGMQVNYTSTNASALVINVRPTLPAFGNQSSDELVLFNLNAAGTDEDRPAQTLSYALTNSPTGASINPSTGLISWTPTEAQGPMVSNITVLVTDNGTPNLTVSRTFQITINEINVPPVLTLPPNQAINEQALFNATATATDSDLPANTWAFELVSGPSGLTVGPDGAIAWTPGENQGPGNYTVTVRVTDTNVNAVNEQHLSTTNSFMLTVREVNLPPVLTVPANQVLLEETVLNVSASTTDPDLLPNALNFGLVAPPAGMTIDPATGAISWTPSEAQGSNVYTITVTVTDNSPEAVNEKQLTVTNVFQVTVNESNRPPVLIVPGDQTVLTGTTLNLAASATDPDIPANTLTFALVSPPTGMSIGSTNGAILWPPTIAQRGVHTIAVMVTDDNPDAVNEKHLSVTNNFIVTVRVPPTILTQPVSRTNECGSDATFTVEATSTDPMIYRWFFNGTNLLSEGPSASIAVSNAHFWHAGDYTVVVSNQLGSVTSTVAMLTVVDTTPPEIVCPLNFVVTIAATEGHTTVSYAVPMVHDNCSGATFLCTPASGTTFAAGTNTVVCVATDGSGNTNACSFTILVNRAPLAGGDSMVTVENQSASVSVNALLANDSDADGDALSIAAVSPGSTNGGTVQRAGTNVVYTPAANFSGQDLFTYTVSDGLGGTASGSVVVNVLASNSPSYNRITDFAVGADRVGMKLQGVTSRTYKLERSQDLRHWSPVASVRAAADGIVHLEDPAPTPGAAFYRISGQ